MKRSLQRLLLMMLVAAGTLSATEAFAAKRVSSGGMSRGGASVSRGLSAAPSARPGLPASAVSHDDPLAENQTQGDLFPGRSSNRPFGSDVRAALLASNPGHAFAPDMAPSSGRPRFVDQVRQTAGDQIVSSTVDLPPVEPAPPAPIVKPLVRSAPAPQERHFVLDRLMHQQFVERGCRGRIAGRHCVEPRWRNVGWAPPMFFDGPIVEEFRIGDLELTGIKLLSEPVDGNGPVYRICIRNTSDRLVEHFRVTAVAVLDEIDQNSPHVTIDVPRLPAGETGEITIELPMTAFAMIGAGAEPVPFNSLVVAIDSFDEIVESNEDNNIATYVRTEIEVIEAPVPTVELPAPGEATVPRTPTEGIDLDNLEIGDAEGAALRLLN